MLKSPDDINNKSFDVAKSFCNGDEEQAKLLMEQNPLELGALHYLTDC
jgi:hypothetical protein